MFFSTMNVSTLLMLHFQVVLLGKFNAQDLENNHELLVRVTKGKSLT